MKCPKDARPVLLFNSGPNDRKACHVVMASGMPCEFLATEDKDTPKLIHGFREFTGVNEIKEFVKTWKNK